MISELLKDTVLKLEKQIEDNVDLRHRNVMLVKKVRQLEIELESKVTIHPSLRAINNDLIQLERRNRELNNSLCEAISEREEKQKPNFLDLMLSTFLRVYHR